MRTSWCPGAYGVGFIQNDRFVVMDLGAHELLNVGSHHDAELHRPMPLQVLDTPAAGTYRFYEGRSFVAMGGAHSRERTRVRAKEKGHTRWSVAFLCCGLV